MPIWMSFVSGMIAVLAYIWFRKTKKRHVTKVQNNQDFCRIDRNVYLMGWGRRKQQWNNWIR